MIRYATPARQPAEPQEITPPRPHTPARTVLKHLAPGVPLTLVILLGGPLAGRLGLPAVVVAFAAILLVLVPLELTVLVRCARRESTGRIRDLVAPQRARLRPAAFAAWLVPVLTVQIAVYALLWAPIESALRSHVFGWLPATFFLSDGQTLASFGPAAVAVTLGLGLVANGVVAPVVEELYFRGYLLPRMTRLGGWAPVVEAFLFSAYHLFAPWQLISRFLFALPFVAAAWRTRSLALSISIHIADNTTSMILLYAAYRSAR